MTKSALQDFAIGDLSRRAGVNVETIRYYERAGVMPRPPRTASGRRAYTEKDLQTLAFIRRSRDLGFSLEDVRALLPLRSAGTCLDVRAIAVRHLEDIRTKLRHLADLEKTLAEALARCPADKSFDCTILEVLEDPSISRALRIA
jgi:MerR family transcriptional regulator, mercuric resistance operon regulatory protein